MLTLESAPVLARKSRWTPSARSVRAIEVAPSSTLPASARTASMVSGNDNSFVEYLVRVEGLPPLHREDVPPRRLLPTSLPGDVQGLASVRLCC
jgi:hypothetical protein